MAPKHTLLMKRICTIILFTV